MLKHAVDDLAAGVTRGKLAYYALLLRGLAIGGWFFRYLMRRVVIGVSRHIEYDLRNDFFRHLERFPLSFYQANRTGDLMSRATNDLNAVRMMIGPSVMYSASTLLTFVIAITMMLTIDPWLTLVALVPLPFVSISVKVFGLGHQRGRPGSPLGCTGRQSLRTGGLGAGAVPACERGVREAQPRPDPAAGDVLSEHDALSRLRRVARAVAGQP